MPYLTKEQIETIGARVVRAYSRLSIHHGQSVLRIEPKILANELLGLTILYVKLATKEDILGLTSPGEVDIGVIGEDGTFQYQHIDGKTIIVDSSLLEEDVIAGHLNFTLMHEVCHQIYKMLFPKAYALETKEGTIHYCRRRPHRSTTDWEEWRTDALAAAILMPPELIRYYLHQYGFGDRMEMLNRVFARSEYQRFTEMAHSLGVSKTALAIRLRELHLIGRDYFTNPYDLVNVYVDDEWIRQEELDYAALRCENEKS